MTNPKRKGPPRRRDEISIASEILPDGRYGIVLSYGDTVRIMAVEDVTYHCQAVVQAAVYAEYDAGIVHQLHTRVGLPLEAVGEVLELVRAKRPALNIHATHPLGFEPGVNKEGKPFVGLLVNGHKVGQWDPDDMRNHALGCLDLAAAVALDNTYRDVLTEDVDLGERARGIVGDVGRSLPHYKVVQA